MKTNAEIWPSHIWLAAWISKDPLLPMVRDLLIEVLAFARNLMARDEFKNLGFKDDAKPKPKSDEQGVKGELRW